jgi:uncharacterized protein (TIGR04255 family)
MAKPRPLRRPPITEALVDFGAEIQRPKEIFEGFAETLKPEFPKIEVVNEFRAQLRVEAGKLIPPDTEHLGFAGIRLSSPDEKLILQLRPNGLTLNNVKGYIGGDEIITRALSLWAGFANHMGIRSVRRIAFRYINHFQLPFRDGDEFNRFLTVAPQMPEQTPQDVTEFLSRVVVRVDERNATAIVTQRLNPAQPGSTFMIDLDVYRQGEFSANPDDLRPVLESLRVLRNEIFFGLLTEEAVELFA